MGEKVCLGSENSVIVLSSSFLRQTQHKTQTTMQTTKLSLSILALGAASSFGAIVWTVGDSATAGRQAPEIWSHNGSSGTTTFVQEGNGPTNSIPGDQFSPATNQQADDDFYFAGNYTNQVDGGPIYTPHGIVAATGRASNGPSPTATTGIVSTSTSRDRPSRPMSTQSPLR